MFYIKKFDDFKIKKTKGIFLYDYNQNKIKYLSNYQSIFTYSSKSIKTHYKNYLSKGWGTPFTDILNNKQKENILKLFFLNKELYRYFGKIEIYENKKKLNSIFKKTITNSLKNILIDFKGNISLLNIISEYISEKSDPIYYFTSEIKSSDLPILKKFKSLEKEIINSIYQNNFNFISNIKDSLIILEGFPYWINDFNISFIKSNIKKEEFKQFKTYFKKILEQLFYFSINFNLTLFDDNIDDNQLGEILNAYINMGFFEYKDFLINQKIKQFYYQPFFIDYLLLQFRYNSIIKYLKQNGNKIIIDECISGYRLLPFSTFFNFKDIYSNINTEQNIFNNSEYFDIIIFGNNLSTGLNINIIIHNENSQLFKYIKNLHNQYHNQNQYYNPFALELLKYGYLKLKQSLILKEFYKNLEYIEYNFSYKLHNFYKKLFNQNFSSLKNNLVFNNFFSLTGPYIKIYPENKEKLILFIKNLSILLPFKTNEIKTIFLNIFKIYSKFNYGVLQVNLKQQDIDSLNATLKKFIKLYHDFYHHNN